MKKTLSLILACLLITGCGPVPESLDEPSEISSSVTGQNSVPEESASDSVSNSDSTGTSDSGSASGGSSSDPHTSSTSTSSSSSSSSSSTSSTTTSSSSTSSSTTSSSKPQSSSISSTTTSSSKPQSSSISSTATSSSKPQSSSISSTTTSSSKPQSSSTSSTTTSSSSPASAVNTQTPPPDDIIGRYEQRSQAAWEIEYANEVFQLVNKERVNAGLPEFKKMEDLTKSATVRAWECLVSYGHDRPDGKEFSTALDEQGIRWRSCGENIAAGQKTPQQVVTAWMNSPGHRANILSENFTYLGVGFYYDYNGANGSYRYYWAQNFCTLF